MPHERNKFGEPIEHDESDDDEVQRPNTILEEFAPDRFGWEQMVGSIIVGEMGSWAQINGADLNYMEQAYDTYSGQMFDAINSNLLMPANRKRDRAGNILNHLPPGEVDPRDFGVQGMGSEYYTGTLEGMQELTDWARNWMSAKARIDLSSVPKGYSGPGGRGGGARKPTAAEIRAQFDVDGLARTVNELNRAINLEEHADPKTIARKYIDAVVASGGEQKIDFENYVRTGIEGSARFKSIYTNKPEAVTPEAYITPYLQNAMALASPNEAADIAIGGARFGASAEDFRQRLSRTDAQTGSAPFINQLEGRMNAMSSVLKG